MEGLLFIAQAVAILVSAMMDKLLPEGQLILVSLAVGHLLLGMAAFRYGGPFYLGGGWPVLWFGLVLIVPLIVAHLVAPTEYAASPTCVQLCGYPAPAAILFAFYPWLSAQYAVLRELIAVGMLVAVVIEPLLIVLAINDHPTRTNFLSVATSSVSVVLGFALGKALGIIFRRAAEKERILATQIYDKHREFLHTRALGGGRIIRNIYGPHAKGLKELAEFQQSVRKLRAELLTRREYVPLGECFTDYARAYERVLRDSPQIGSMVVPEATASLIAKSLGDLLRNAAEHGDNVWVYFEITNGVGVLDVVDDGPGFPNQVMDRPGNLHNLREEARAAGGDLVRLDQSPRGSRMRLTIPVLPRQRRRGGRSLATLDR